MVFDKTLMDTQKSVLHFDGEAVLKTQELRSKITADTKQFDLLDLHSPVLIEGKIRSPSISLGRKIPIPTPDFGGANGQKHSSPLTTQGRRRAVGRPDCCCRTLTGCAGRRLTM